MQSKSKTVLPFGDKLQIKTKNEKKKIYIFLKTKNYSLQAAKKIQIIFHHEGAGKMNYNQIFKYSFILIFRNNIYLLMTSLSSLTLDIVCSIYHS